MHVTGPDGVDADRSQHILGKGKQAECVLGSLVVDDAALERELNWTPLYTFKVGLRATVNWYLGRSDA